MKQKYTLLVTLLLFCLKGISQSYTVTPIPFQQYTGSLASLSTVDDINSQVISLPFSFDFYGVSYNQVVISTNGYIDFRTTSAGTLSPWSLTNNMTIPNIGFNVKNAILGAYHDMDNSNSQGTITYGISGNAPYRKFVVYYYNNSHFGPCSAVKSSFQMILNETTNIVDVQLIDKQMCTSWNNGNCVIGLINLAGDDAIAAPGRNTGAWTAFHEGWRFNPTTTTSTTYNFIKCDANLDGFEDFNLAVVQNDLAANNPSSIVFYPTLADAQTFTNQISSLVFANVTPNAQTIYARVLGTATVYNINLSVLDCSIDYDADTIATENEDLNTDTNLANDDTDADGLSNFNDNDDDGDLILTNLEYVFTNRNEFSLLDTDNDGIWNYLDNDDDGDGLLTIEEDYNGNNNPADDDTNNDGTPDYLQMSVTLGTTSYQFANQVSIYPNPTSDILNIDNKSQDAITNVSVYSIKGDLVKNLKSNFSLFSVSDLQNGVYFVKIEMNKTVLNYKFVKN
jgi:hypothetical protein